MTNNSGAGAICIVGDSRSGSTIFQGLLELHGDVTAVGELRRLERFLADGSPCSCGEPVTRCEHWRAIMQRAGLRPEEIRTQPPSQKWLRRFEEVSGLAGVALQATALIRALLPQGARVADHSARLLTAAAEIAGARFVVDNSKDPGHAIYLLHQKRLPVHVVFNMRDGRGTVWSKMRRTGISLEAATHHWTLTTRAMLALHSTLGADRSTWLRYEDLCADPRGTVGKFVALLGLNPADFTETVRPRHEIGGTPDFSGVSFEAVRQDTRWRDEMPAPAQAGFESIAGKLNRRLGYR